jgi:hypothetical protein
MLTTTRKSFCYVVTTRIMFPQLKRPPDLSKLFLGEIRCVLIIENN